MRRFGVLRSGPQALTGARAQIARTVSRTKLARLASVTVLFLLCAITAAGCGPVGYLQQVHGRAADAVAEAKRAGAAAAAPYEYTSAVVYLAKARDEGDRAEYQSAIEFGRRAEAFALQASAIARRREAKRPTPANDTAPDDGAAGATGAAPSKESP